MLLSAAAAYEERIIDARPYALNANALARRPGLNPPRLVDVDAGRKLELQVFWSPQVAAGAAPPREVCCRPSACLFFY